ncbi:MAG: hypothetical protein E7577_00335 [Ruminococcaceae bacterium]|nr:hypothetical protein [Oscillospiraceae bacterium]
MNKKILSIVLVLSMLVGMLAVMPISVGAADADDGVLSGKGTENDPYIIAGLVDWATFVTDKKSAGDYYKVTATTLDFTGKTYNQVASFQGTFDGNGVTITGVNVNSSGEAGLFSCLGGVSTFKNFVVTNSTIKGNQWVGGVVCCCNGNATFENIYISDDVKIIAGVKSGNSYSGGLLGGGAGSPELITVRGCVFAGTVTAEGQYNGGFIGSRNGAKNIEIYNSIVLGKVPNTKANSCGFIGHSESTNVVMDNCIYAGGAAGVYYNNRPFFNKSASATVTNCYTVAANDNNTGAVYGDVKITDENNGVKLITFNQLIGYDADVDVDGFTTRAGDVMVPSGVAGFDLPQHYVAPQVEEWTGSGTESDPYTISTAAQWRYFVEQSATNDFSGKYIELARDITLNEGDAAEWAKGNFSGIAINSVCEASTGKSFAGNFNGNGKTISGVYINSSYKEGVGLFGEVGKATITNFRLVNSYIQGTEWMGGVVGETNGNGTVISNIYVGEDVYVKSTKSGGSGVGGVVGGIYGTTTNVTIDNCVFAGTVTGSSAAVAGILGNANKASNVTISDCLFLGTSSKNGITYIANLKDVESRAVIVTRCVSIGTATNAVEGSDKDGVTVSDCYWVGNGLSSKYDVFDDNASAEILTALGADWTTRTDDFITLDMFADVSNFVLEDEFPNTVEWETAQVITNAKEWNYFVFLAQVKRETFAGKTVYLNADIDFKNATIKTLAPDGVATFQGTFDGQGHTLKRFVIDDTVDATSVFGDIRGGAVIKNLVIDSATVYASQWAGVVVGEVSGEATIENVFVTEDVKLYSNRGTKQGEVGGIVGGLYGEGSVTVRGCVFAGEIYSNGKTVGGIVGRGNSLSVTIEDCLMLGSVECALEDSDANGILGWNKDKVNTDKDTGEITSVQEGTTVIRNTVYAGWGYSSYSFGSFGKNTTIENCYSTDAKYAYCIEVDQPEYGSVNHIEKTDIINNPELVAKLNNGRATDVWRLRGGDAIVPADVIADDVYLINVHMFNGASVRFSDTSDIRFTGIIGSNYLESKKAEGKTVKFGILISLASYVELLGDKDFTPANFDALGEEVINGTRYVMIEATNYGGGEEDGYYIFSGVLWGLKSNTREYAARTYIQIIDDATGEIDRTLLSYYNPTDNNRSIAYVAQAAYEDTCNFSNGYYKHELAEGQGVYSPYTPEQREKLLDLFGKEDATDISFLSYNIRNVEDTSGWIDKATFEYTDRNIYVRDYLLDCGADVIGLQEAAKLKATANTLDWFDTLGDGDTNVGLVAAGYTCVKGEDILSHDGDKDMYNPIYFKTDKYELVTSGTKWLTATPDVCSVIDGSDTRKALNYVVLKDIATGQQFVYVNVHLVVRRTNYVHDGEGADTEHYCQELEVIYLRGILDALQKDYADLPMFIGGDFNNSYSGINKWFSKSVVGENPWDISEGTPTETVKISTARDQAITKSSYLYSCTTEDFTQVNTDAGANVWSKWGAIDLWWTSNFTNGVVHCYQILDNKTTTSTGEKYPSDHLPAKMCVTIYKDNA